MLPRNTPLRQREIPLYSRRMQKILFQDNETKKQLGTGNLIYEKVHFKSKVEGRWGVISCTGRHNIMK